MAPLDIDPHEFKVAAEGGHQPNGKLDVAADAGHQPNGKLDLRPSTGKQPGRLPLELSSFIGREDAVAECCTLIRRRRLVTLTGPGGIGKSRLALQVARCAAEEFADGAFLAELASVEEAALVPRVIATALGLAERAGEELTDMLGVALRSQQLLLIMDDCDRQVEACAALAIQLLRGVPGLTILATSRERLDVRGEVVLRVPSLKTPAPNAGFDEIANSEAVALFVERAREVAPWFRLERGNAPRAAQLCRRLDGIPLAIELAAARMKALDLDQLLTRLEGSFEFTMRGSRTAPTRQQTLRATIDFSYQLLNSVERALFRRLSVFSGGFTIDAVESVTQGEPLGQADTLPVLERLIDKSLVIAETTRCNMVRQRMLESLRDYARRRLLEAGEEEQFRRRHFDWVLNLIECIHADHLTLETVKARVVEVDNLRAALAWAVDASEGQRALRLAEAAGGVWDYNGHFAEGIRWLTRALELPGATDMPSTRVSAFKWIAILSYGLGDMRAASDACSKADELRAGGPEPDKPPLCAGVLGNIERAVGHLDAALALYRQALQAYQERGLHFWEQVTLFCIGSALFEQENYAASRDACEQCIALDAGVAFATARAQVILAYLANHDGKHIEAEHLAEQAVTRFRAQGQESGIGIGLRALAQFALDQGRLSRAWMCLAEALDIALMQGDRMSLARTLETVACVLAGDAPADAAQIAGAASALRTRTGTVPWPTEQARLDRWLGMAQARSGKGAYMDSWRFGTGLSDAEAAAAARQFVAAALASHEISQPVTVMATPLTARQIQVAALVADGLTNQQIGAHLVISPATARAHVEHILGRLELHGRAALAAWAVAHGLAAGDKRDSSADER